MTKPYNRNMARSIAQQAFTIMLTNGRYSGSIGNAHWSFDANEWRVIVTYQNGQEYNFTPAKSWLA